MEQPSAGSDARPPNPKRGLEETPWVHITPEGVEYGSERPRHTPQSALKSLWVALETSYRLRSTLWVLVVKEFKSRYRAQALGLFWSLAYPLLMMVTVTIAFVYVLRVDIPNFPVFYLIGALFWHCFSNATTGAAGTFVEYGALVKRTTFPRYLLPIARVLSNFLNFLMECVLLFAFYFVFPDAFVLTYRVIALPFLVLLLFVMLVGISMMVAAMNVQYRDVFYIVTSLITVGFWFSPVLYPTSMATSPALRMILRINPLSGVIEGAREVIMQGKWPNPEHLVPGIVMSVVVFMIGCLVFRKFNLTLADHL
jgi:ABC-type polysaccharide/polyol phosphate export permease